VYVRQIFMEGSIHPSIHSPSHNICFSRDRVAALMSSP
jgi:hypothetical protein